MLGLETIPGIPGYSLWSHQWQSRKPPFRTGGPARNKSLDTMKL